MEYEDFLKTKVKSARNTGFEPNDLPCELFPHQKIMVEMACKNSGAACFYDTGLGKTIIELSTADQWRRKFNKPVLLLAPLSVGKQTAKEAKKFGFDDVKYLQTPDEIDGKEIVITNYERMHLFAPETFSSVICDESSIIKQFVGKTTQKLFAFSKNLNCLAATATPSPNDHKELGQHSQLLRVKSAQDVIATWFVHDPHHPTKYRLKGHAVDPFWQWVSTWAKSATKPSDLGNFSDDGYDLEPFDLIKHQVTSDILEDVDEGMLFRVAQDLSATNMHKEKRRTLEQRAKKIAELVHEEKTEPWIIWCDTNDEADVLKKLIPEAVEVRGDHKPEIKEERLDAFANGSIRVLITKPKIASMGLNWQHCARVAFVGLSYSYEAFYQAIRRCWRFGQKRKVKVHVAISDIEASIWDSISRKKNDHDVMKLNMVKAMSHYQSDTAKNSLVKKNEINLPGFI